MDMRTGRAWVEIDLEALANNVDVLQRQLAPGCALMAVVKANAYGHGDIPVARELERLGVGLLAVASAGEALRLRAAGIQGDILIMGYTPPALIAPVAAGNIIQAVVNRAHAEALSESGIPLRVHVKVDTGMHRLGQDPRELGALAGIYHMPNLRVEGSFTHLCVADMACEETRQYTQNQIDAFFAAMRALQAQGTDPGGLHIQNSYGIAGCGPLACTWARAGILLYGAKIEDGDSIPLYPQLRPVAAVRARVAQLRRLAKGQRLGYGLTFTAPGNMAVAVITIGYADGIPRSLSNGGGEALLHGHRAPIIGRICMDMLMLDVTSIPGVMPNDVATFIGADGDDVIRVEALSAADGSITHETLTQLGPRLPRVCVRGGRLLPDAPA